MNHPTITVSGKFQIGGPPMWTMHCLKFTIESGCVCLNCGQKFPATVSIETGQPLDKLKCTFPLFTSSAGGVSLGRPPRSAWIAACLNQRGDSVLTDKLLAKGEA
ncbi:MAG: hypothetical protein AB1705_13010 [Verrucomicrobiota bacterium]